MVRIVCSDMVANLMKNQVYPTLDDKKELALKIVNVFPILRTTKVVGTAPDYSMFFWKNGGRGSAYEHTGLIQTHIRNSCKNLLPEKKKFTHKPKVKLISNVSSDTVKKAEDIACKDPVLSNFNVILKTMVETHSLHVMLLHEKKKIQDIFSILPHLKAYNGLMIQKAYEKMNTAYNKESHLKNVISRGLMLENETFIKVRDDNLRGCLRILVVLGNRGIRRPAGVESLPVDEQIAAPLVRWIPYHETSLAEQLAKYVALNLKQQMDPHLITDDENFYIYVHGEVVSCGRSSLQALDTFFKSFYVFGIAVPAALRKLIEFFEIISYKVKENSSTQGVSRLIASFSESIKAEMSDSESSS